MQRNNAFLLDVLNAAEMAKKFTSHLTKKEFLESSLVQSGVLHQIIIIGEAVKRLSAEFRQDHPSDSLLLSC